MLSVCLKQVSVYPSTILVMPLLVPLYTFDGPFDRHVELICCYQMFYHFIL